MALKWVLSLTKIISYTNDTTKLCPEANHTSLEKKASIPCFQMPLHYPRYSKADYENMEEWRVNMLLVQYGLGHFKGTLQEKRGFAMGAFLWPNQL